MSHPSVSPGVSPAIARVRPPQVSGAMLLLCVSFGLFIVTAALLQPDALTSRQTGLIQVVSSACFAWLIYEIWAGRNWARVVFTYLWALGTVLYAPMLVESFEVSFAAGAVYLTDR